MENSRTSASMLRWGALATLLLTLPAAASSGEELSLSTSDGVRISASIRLPEGEGPHPAVVLIHQGGSDRGEWAGWYEPLLRAGYAVLAYDVRGHGASDPVDSIVALFDDPELAPRDLHAALAHLRARPEVDGARLGVIGSSIGANLACVAVSELEVRTAVFLSGKTSAAENLARRELTLSSVFYVSSEGDQGGRRASWARELFERTEPPRQLEIVADSAAHGVSILADAPGLLERVVAWLDETL